MDLFRYPVSLLSDSASVHEETLLGELLESKDSVIDLWHTKCIRCPAALDRLDEEAMQHPEVQFIACALSLGVEGEVEKVQQMTARWPHLRHLFLSEDSKEMMKERFAFSSVPFAFAVSKVTRISL